MVINDAFACGLQQDRSNTFLARPISSCQRLLVESHGDEYYSEGNLEKKNLCCNVTDPTCRGSLYLLANIRIILLLVYLTCTFKM